MRSLLTRLGPFAKGFAGAVVGVLLVLLLVHLWFDHAALHAIVDLVNKQAAGAAAAPK